jgi:predicted dehydrogenase
MADLRAAIIGYGLAGRVFHAPLIAATPGMEVAAIVTADPGRRSQAMLAHPGAEILDDADAVWARAGALDLVVVATANDAHVPLARVAIERRLAVVVDKPLAVDGDQAQALVDDARAARVALTVFQNRRWDAEQLLLATLLDEGTLGTVLRVESRLERWRPNANPEAWRERGGPQQGGGLLLDLGSHLVDQVLHRFGPAREVYAEIEHRRGLPADDDVFLALTHDGGVISHLYASAVAAAPGPRLRVFGSDAALLAPAVDTQEDRLAAGERPDTASDWGVEPEYARPRLIAGERSVPLSGPPGDWPAFYAGVRDALTGAAPLPVDPQDAVAALRVLDAARLSAAEGRVVALG